MALNIGGTLYEFQRLPGLQGLRPIGGSTCPCIAVFLVLVFSSFSLRPCININLPLLKSQTDRYVLPIPINTPILTLHYFYLSSKTLSTNTSHIFIAINLQKLQPIATTILMEAKPKMSKPVKQLLGQLLQQEQEPFILEAYLEEKGYLKKGLNSSKLLKKSPGGEKRIRYCSKIIRNVFNSLISIHDSSRKKPFNCENGRCGSVIEMGRSSQEAAELDRFVFNSCSEKEMEETFRALKVCGKSETDERLKGRSVEDSKQLSPVSVLQETPYDEGSPIHSNKHNFILRKKVTDDHLLSASLWELLVHLPAERPNFNQVAELQEFVGFNFFTHHLKSKRASRQLLFDCIREVVEIHQRERKQQDLREFLGPEDLGKIICDKLKYWGKQSGDETSITQLLHFDYLASAQEWSEFEPHTREISVEIGDAILEDINNEIVTDMVDILKKVY